MAPDSDYIDGCDVDMADPLYTSDDEEQVLAVVLFSDLPTVGEHVGADGRLYPTVDPDALALRVADLHALAGTGPVVDYPSDPDPGWFGAHGQGEALPMDDDDGTAS